MAPRRYNHLEGYDGEPHDDIPLDSAGAPLAWPDPADPDSGWHIDAWNGVYESRQDVIDEARYWTAEESTRVLAYGEEMIAEDEMLRRQSTI
jgi:hypothetical protein